MEQIQATSTATRAFDKNDVRQADETIKIGKANLMNGNSAAFTFP